MRVERTAVFVSLAAVRSALFSTVAELNNVIAEVQYD
jgi:hypothetical protein